MRKVKPVIVKWVDAFHIPAYASWVNPEELKKAYKKSPKYTYTAGFIISKTRKELIIAQSFDPSSGYVHASSIYIPRSWVEEIIKVQDESICS
jgi:hypothetical protein